MKKRLAAILIALASPFALIPSAVATTVYTGSWHCEYLDHGGYYKDVHVCTRNHYRHRIGVRGWYVVGLDIKAYGCYCVDRIYGLTYGLNGLNHSLPAKSDNNGRDDFSSHYWTLNFATGADPAPWAVFGTVGEVLQTDQKFHTHGEFS